MSGTAFYLTALNLLRNEHWKREDSVRMCAMKVGVSESTAKRVRSVILFLNKAYAERSSSTYKALAVLMSKESDQYTVPEIANAIGCSTKTVANLKGILVAVRQAEEYLRKNGAWKGSEKPNTPLNQDTHPMPRQAGSQSTALATVSSPASSATGTKGGAGVERETFSQDIAHPIAVRKDMEVPTTLTDKSFKELATLTDIAIDKILALRMFAAETLKQLKQSNANNTALQAKNDQLNAELERLRRELGAANALLKADAIQTQ